MPRKKRLDPRKTNKFYSQEEIDKMKRRLKHDEHLSKKERAFLEKAILMPRLYAKKQHEEETQARLTTKSSLKKRHSQSPDPHQAEAMRRKSNENMTGATKLKKRHSQSPDPHQAKAKSRRSSGLQERGVNKNTEEIIDLTTPPKKNQLLGGDDHGSASASARSANPPVAFHTPSRYSVMEYDPDFLLNAEIFSPLFEVGELEKDPELLADLERSDWVLKMFPKDNHESETVGDGSKTVSSESEIVPRECESETVPRERESETIPREGESETVPREGETFPRERESETVPRESETVPTVPRESETVPRDESETVPREGETESETVPQIFKPINFGKLSDDKENTNNAHVTIPHSILGTKESRPRRGSSVNNNSKAVVPQDFGINWKGVRDSELSNDKENTNHAPVAKTSSILETKWPRPRRGSSFGFVGYDLLSGLNGLNDDFKDDDVKLAVVPGAVAASKPSDKGSTENEPVVKTFPNVADSQPPTQAFWEGQIVFIAAGSCINHYGKIDTLRGHTAVVHVFEQGSNHIKDKKTKKITSLRHP